MKSIVVVLVAGQSDVKRRHMRELGKHVRTTPQWSLPNEICFEGIQLVSWWVHIQLGLAIATSRFVRY